MQAPTGGSLLTVFVAVACALSGIASGLLLAGPLVAIPALFAAPSLSARSRLHVWSRLEAESTALVGSILPLLTGSLALCALLAQSASPSRARSDYYEEEVGGWIGGIAALVGENRRSLFVLAAILTLGLRQYSFGLLTPRIEALKAEEKRLLLLGLARTSNGLDRALGRSGWRGASPALEVVREGRHGENGEEKRRSEGEDGDESDEEDNALLDDMADKGALAGSPKVQDTDRLIIELSRLQFGPAILCGAAFALTVLDLVCA
ncbi:hypothetical protein JCM10908_000227 [Rhodotorula pacifica]|uniref:uncharacterized protein n=1 Tax=Rhodotorula pacifica TaxID=1495444 RepID=UPI003181484C